MWAPAQLALWCMTKIYNFLLGYLIKKPSDTNLDKGKNYLEERGKAKRQQQGTVFNAE
jgi:hypothetical protein